MTSLLYGSVSHTGVPADENIVRMTTAPVTPDAPPAMADHAPDPNQVETDPNPLLGMSTRQLASTWHEGQQYSPSWAGSVDDADNHNAIVDKRISSSGTAAAREASGVFGHGTLSYAEGIESVGDLREGGSFGNEYFKVHDKNIQGTSGDYMTVAPGMDQDTVSRVSAASKDASRQASVAAAYRNMWAGVQGS